MYASTGNYTTILKKITGKLLQLLILVICSPIVNGQNVNKPNKMGPMGTQVNTFTGNLYLSRNDIYIPARGFNIAIAFTYNSFNFDQDAGFGNGWGFIYSIKYKNDTADSKTITWGDGREDNYTVSPDGLKPPKGNFNSFTQYEANKYLLTEPNGTKFYFDNSTHKKITRLEEPNGNYINFTYNDTLLTSLATKAGQSILFAYDVNGRLATVVDAVGTPSRNYTYTYESNGNLKQITDPLGGAYKYSYLINGPMKSMTDKNNNTVNIIYFKDFSVSELIGCNKRVSFSYDTATNITIATDHLATGNNQVTKYGYKAVDGQVWLTSLSGNCCGFNMSFAFDANGNKIKETDGKGLSTSFTYDAKGNMLTMTDALNQSVSYTYSADFNRITSYTDPKGFITQMEYDNRGNLIQLTEPGNRVYTATYNNSGDITGSTDPKGNSFIYSYDAQGNPLGVAGPDGYNATLGFDARGNLLSYADARGNTSSLEYDILDRLKKITDPLSNSINLAYDAEGNIISVNNENNENSLFGFDASNRIVKVTDAMGNKRYTTYDGMDNLTSITNAAGHLFKFNYDARNRMSAVTDPSGNHTNITYDANGNITAIHLPNGELFNYSYDAVNRLTSISDISGNIAAYTYDRNGNITGFTNGTGAVMTAVYDSVNRIKKVTDPLGNSAVLAYDKNSNIISLTDRNGFTTHYTYDALNRVKTMTDNNGFAITASYDAQDNLISLKDQRDNITSYTYDSLNRVRRTTFPDGRFTEYTYNKKGNIISSRLTDGTNVNFTYNALNRIIAKTLPDGHAYSYTYDVLGRLLSATNNAGTVTITYDALNRVKSETFNGRTVNYDYNTAGRMQTTTYPDGTAVTKNFDTRNRLISITRNNAPLVTYQYNNANQLVATNFANGVNTNSQYDFANRLSNLSSGNANIQHTDFSFDNQQNKTTISRLNNPVKSEQYTYDNGYRMINYKRGIIGGTPTIQNSYTYDSLGNRSGSNMNGINTSYTSNSLNQLINSNNGTQSINFTYDNNGNLTYDGRFYKTYDAERRLLKDSSSPSNVLTYQYDALGRRVQRNLNGSVLQYTFSGMMPIEERDNASGTTLNKTIFSGFLTPVANEKNNTIFYYHQNELNSVEAITNEQGRLMERYEYDPYGKMMIYDSLNNLLPGSLTGNRFGFTGQVYDSSNGTYKFFYRDYNPETGLFNQRDWIEYADGMGLYQYVHNNPANGIDILGLKDCPDVATHDPSRSEKIERLINFYNSHFGNIVNIASTTEKGSNELIGKNKYVKGANYGAQVVNLATSIDLFNKDMPNLSSEEFDIRAAEIEANMVYLAADVAGDVPGANKSPALPLIKAAQYTGKLDAFSQEVTGKSLSRHYAELDDAAQAKGREMAMKMPGNQRRFDKHEEYLRDMIEKYGSDRSKWTDEMIQIADIHSKAYEVGFRYSKADPNCPQNGNNGGTQRPKPKEPGTIKPVIAVGPKDPNAIIGPDGQPDQRWVNVKERLPYTILYENDKTASAPAKFVRVTSPIEPKQDAATFQLGNFGFNNQTFAVPPNTASYYERLDCRDSLGLYVDITAGYDQINNVAFWEFQSIDPVTLLAPADPFKGFLLMQDSSQVLSGHGFVNFSIKPRQTAVTLDTIGARAAIVFDFNDTIPTNIASNTIDAIAPTSSITDLDDYTPDTEVSLHYTGIDDLNGSGVKSYSIYVADNGGEMELYVANFKGTDTTFIGIPEHTYKFYASATDIAGNVESIHFLDSTRIINGELVICPGSNITFDSKLNTGSYQWQVDNGTGFVNISNDGIYSGVNNKMLTLTAPPTSMYGYKYRCVANGTVYSQLFLLKFGMSWEGTADNSWENPANWNCGSLPDEHTDVTIGTGKLTYPQINSNVTIRSLRMQPGASGTVNSGFRLSILK